MAYVTRSQFAAHAHPPRRRDEAPGFPALRAVLLFLGAEAFVFLAGVLVGRWMGGAL